MAAIVESVFDSRTTSTALQGQVVVYAGPAVATFIARFSTMGLVLVRP